MKKTLYFAMFLAGFAAMLNGCTVNNVTRNEYFGYTNTPKHIEKVAPASSSDDDNTEWVNPLREEYDDRDNFQISYSAGYMPPYYMPVVVPWWGNTYSYYNRPFTGMYSRMGWGMYDLYDWYSPFYTYCPIYYSPWIYHQNPWWDWYGYNYGHYYRPGHDNGWKRNHDNDNRRNNYAVRDFGPSRGTYSTIEKPYAGVSSSKSVRGATKSTLPVKSQGIGNKAESAPKIIYKPATPERKSFESGNSKSSSKSSRSGEKVKYDSPNSNSNSSGSGYNPSKSSESKPSGSSGKSESSGNSGNSGNSGSSSNSSRSSTKTK